jgi:3-methyl-2-oxobutanoate hydroxymethyltransferase
MKKKLTVQYFRKLKENNETIVALTAYDAFTANLAQQCGVEFILVGDSLGMALLGYDTTIQVTLDQMLHHCAATRRGAPSAFIVGDMPFMTYQCSPEEAMKNAAKFIQVGGADAVKLEGGKEMAGTIKRLVDTGIPVVGHIGLLPQRVMTSGGYKIAGKTDKDAARLIDDALALEEAGIFSLVLEGMPSEVSQKVTEAISIPTIGIGAGPHCDGQVQVVNDILGTFSDFIPKHAKQYVNLTPLIENAFKEYVSDVKSNSFPTDANSF